MAKRPVREPDLRPWGMVTEKKKKEAMGPSDGPSDSLRSTSTKGSKIYLESEHSRRKIIEDTMTRGPSIIFQKSEYQIF